MSQSLVNIMSKNSAKSYIISIHQFIIMKLILVYAKYYIHSPGIHRNSGFLKFFDSLIASLSDVVERKISFDHNIKLSHYHNINIHDKLNMMSAEHDFEMITDYLNTTIT